ncbi:FtsH-2 peptidase. Metallo peptidase. MEROPS family M41 [Rubrobacter xylanophilus DSM 9941]|uniref:ATP-dependent zinc metalloprotease FtsH n=1 Tax=Rubrobacter xylanophilus (strain DSM 9941 / JCM 11954 / NBRC 16129 / PRD-1) TaxID=266117 RepID=Q1ATZ9_RUBXD|nr:ATP-dependent zinc metalloprotease FtsH [Rubrobacter xylanophilus]ABG05129.1 FtsH-2 peptidase. Metallo peptidase. MEROPS family M41 [Rubrobacter xylanophilus DSM 9941]
MGRILRNGGLLYFIVLLVFAVILVRFLSAGNPDVEKLNSQEFQRAIENNQIKTDIPQGQEGALVVRDEDQTVEGTLKNGQRFEYSYPEYYDIARVLNEANIPFTTDPQNTGFWLTLLGTLGPILLIILFFLLFMSSMQGGGNRVMSFGKSRARRMTKDQPKVTFADVAGADEAVQELTEIKEFLENPQKFQKLGARIPKGALLVGPPGTGKTLLARAVAGEAGVPFFSISGSDFVEMFVGVGASRVRDLFEQAKQNSPCIIFVDEIDAVGRQRGAGLGGGHDEREQTLNQLLVEMDGFDSKSGIIMLAATNRPDILDPALLRPGRFDRQIVVDRPDLPGRIKILKVHTRGKPLGEDVDIETIARGTPGFTGADLANLVNEAALLAARHNKEQIEMAEMEEAIDRVIAGPERKTRLISEKEKEITAYHEAGHAIVGALLPEADPVHKVTIIPRGQALGVTMSLPEEDRFMMSRAQLMAQLSYMLGGRAAERVVFEEITTGASNDIERATKVARQMVTRYGMSEKLGLIALGQHDGQVFMGRDLHAQPDYSDEIAFQIDKEIRRLVDEAYDTAEDLLVRNRRLLEKLASDLIEYETVDAEHLRRLVEEYAVDRTGVEKLGSGSRNGRQD